MKKLFQLQWTFKKLCGEFDSHYLPIKKLIYARYFLPDQMIDFTVHYT